MYRSLSVTLAFFALIVSISQAQTNLPKAQAPSQATPFIGNSVDSARPTADDPPDEDWNTIYLAKSHLPIQSSGGFLLSKVDLPGGCTRELQRVQWRHGDPIDLYVIRPPKEGKLPVVLFLYNYTYDTDLFRQDRWCDLAKRNHYVAVGFASALSWQRFHSPRPLAKWFVSELQEALASSTHDVQMVINYLGTRSDVDARQVAMFGQGSGGAIAILAAAADPRIVALDLMDPWGDWPDWLKGSKQIPDEERPNYLKPEFLQRVQGLDPVDYLPQLGGRAIRIQQLADDPITPAAARTSIARAAPQTDEVTLYPDLGSEAKALGQDGIVGWLGQQLKPEAKDGSVNSQLAGRPEDPKTN